MKINFNNPTVGDALNVFKLKTTRAEAELVYDLYKDIDSEKQNKLKPVCDKFFDTEQYASGEKTYIGYVMCCDVMGYCGMSGWIIFLIILLVLGALAGGAAAFWFFYWKRKN